MNHLQQKANDHGSGRAPRTAFLRVYCVGGVQSVFLVSRCAVACVGDCADCGGLCHERMGGVRLCCCINDSRLLCVSFVVLLSFCSFPPDNTIANPQLFCLTTHSTPPSRLFVQHVFGVCFSCLFFVLFVRNPKLPFVVCLGTDLSNQPQPPTTNHAFSFVGFPRDWPVRELYRRR